MPPTITTSTYVAKYFGFCVLPLFIDNQPDSLPSPPNFSLLLLSNLPSHAISLGHFPTPIHKWNLPKLPKDGVTICTEHQIATGHRCRNISIFGYFTMIVTPAKVNSEHDIMAVGAQDHLQQLDMLSSSSTALDGYFGPQPSMQGIVVQLNLMAPSRCNYYGNQQAVQGLSVCSLWDDGFGIQSGKDFFKLAKDFIKPDGGPPRWFCPILCGIPLKESPLFVFACVILYDDDDDDYSNDLIVISASPNHLKGNEFETK
ncbi:hypothetical protein L2E82_05146 [Cichorium intybus]|uniref:Uncharacterized protein n=1 Tax=Cichorium intybus TaxID=13427 RepID=A0ACB9H6A1_CICIN|nr:hypothetical protein L2E82_05146 [Cichorium intybus]